MIKIIAAVVLLIAGLSQDRIVQRDISLRTVDIESVRNIRGSAYELDGACGVRFYQSVADHDQGLACSDVLHSKPQRFILIVVEK